MKFSLYEASHYNSLGVRRNSHLVDCNYRRKQEFLYGRRPKKNMSIQLGPHKVNMHAFVDTTAPFGAIYRSGSRHHVLPLFSNAFHSYLSLYV